MGIAMGCMISLILFVMIMKVMLDAASGVAEGPRFSEEIKMPQLNP